MSKTRSNDTVYGTARRLGVEAVGPARGLPIVVGAFAFVSLGACRCEPMTKPIIDEPLRVSATRLDFGRVYVGAEQRLTLHVSNPTVLRRSASLDVAAPFAAVESLVLEAGASSALVVTFAPVSAGDARAVVRIDTHDVELKGSGLEPLACSPGAACRTSRFEASRGECVEDPAADGADCTASAACFEKAECRAGACIGTLNRCDDGDACTIDLCGEGGCGHVEALSSCPAPTDPCRVPSCARDAGCGSAAAPDGTACGPRDCSTARVCILGACVIRPAPQTQGCIEVVAGRPGGTGWSDGFATDARFSSNLRISTDAAGNVWVLDLGNELLRKVAPSGAVTTVAGLPHPRAMSLKAASRDGFGAAASIAAPVDLTADSFGNVVFREPWVLRRATPSGLLTTWVGAVPDETAPPLRDGFGPAARVFGSAITRTAGGALWLCDLLQGQDGEVRELSLRHVSPQGEVTTRATIDARGFWEAIDLAWDGQAALVTDADGLHALSPDGGVRTVLPMAGLRRVAASNTGRLAAATETGVVVLSGAGAVVSSWTAPSGSFIRDLDTYPGDRWVVALSSLEEGAGLVVLDPSGATTRLAGPGPRLPVADGPVAGSGLWLPRKLAAGPNGEVWVAGGSGDLRLVVGGQVSSWFALPDGGVFSDLGVVRGVGLVGSTPTGTHRILRPDAGEPWLLPGCWAFDTRGERLACLQLGAPHQLWLGDPSDGGSTPVEPGTVYATVAVDDVNGGAWLGEVRTVTRVFGDGGVFVAAGAPDRRGYADGPGATTARFNTIRGAAVGPSGDLFVVESGNRTVRRVTPAGEVSTVAHLADSPTDVALEDGGTLVISVNHAVLRLRP